ncbi:MAG: hypothetical protein R3C28_32005 [Pirellulaceae bacterium]
MNSRTVRMKPSPSFREFVRIATILASFGKLRRYKPIFKSKFAGGPFWSFMVYFTLKERTAETVSHLIAVKYLSDHPGTVYFSAGQPGGHSPGVNDRDFDVALVGL